MLIKYPVDFFANPKNVFTFAVPKNAGVKFNLKILRPFPVSLNNPGSNTK